MKNIWFNSEVLLFFFGYSFSVNSIYFLLMLYDIIWRICWRFIGFECFCIDDSDEDEEDEKEDED